MIDTNSPAGSWQREIDLMHVKGIKTAPVELCKQAPWHFDPASTYRTRHHLGEAVLQSAIIAAVSDEFDCFISAIPNGGSRGYHSQRQIKLEGVRSGYPDLIIDGQGVNYGKVYRAEIKAGSRVTVDQFECLTTLHENGHKCGVFRSSETLIEAMKREGWR